MLHTTAKKKKRKKKEKRAGYVTACTIQSVRGRKKEKKRQALSSIHFLLYTEELIILVITLKKGLFKNQRHKDLLS